MSPPMPRPRNRLLPLSAMDEVYALRMHLSSLRGGLEQLLARGPPLAVPAERKHG